MDFSTYWDVFKNFLWPALLAYGAWLQARLVALGSRIDAAEKAQLVFEKEVAQTYVTHDVLHTVEKRLTDVLNRIDDKVTRILERDHT
jgi:hypothetical protein